ncbi:MarR family winged helix-turn-helix transcriptional regulator [Streptomyces sp. JNUCC 64]
MENPPGTSPEEPSTRWKGSWEALPGWLLARTAAHAHRLLTEGFATVGARGYHYRLLATLEESGPASQAVLSRRSGIHVSDVVAALNELAADGLIERAPDPSDRRRNVVSLTPAGERRLRRLAESLTESQETLMAPLSPEERRELTGLLSRLLDHHDGRTGTEA